MFSPNQISIIITVYNGEKTINKCYNSIINQNTVSEIIFVDNASTDSTVNIIQSLMKEDKRIKLIKHENNKGVLYSRFDGVMAVTGKYTMFLDVDDEYLPNSISELYMAMEENDVDIIQYKVYSTMDGKRIKDPHTSLFESFLNGTEIFDAYVKNKLCVTPWCRIYKSEICKKAYSSMKIKEGITLAEDVYAMYFIMFYAKSYRGIDKEYYVRNLSNGDWKKPSDEMHVLKMRCTSASFVVKNVIEFLKIHELYDNYSNILYFYILDLCMDSVKKSSENNKNVMIKMVGEVLSEYISVPSIFRRYVLHEVPYVTDGLKITYNSLLEIIRKEY